MNHGPVSQATPAALIADELRLELRAAVGDQAAMVDGFVYRYGNAFCEDGAINVYGCEETHGWKWSSRGHAIGDGVTYPGPRACMRAAIEATK